MSTGKVGLKDYPTTWDDQRSRHPLYRFFRGNGMPILDKHLPNPLIADRARDEDEFFKGVMTPRLFLKRMSEIKAYQTRKIAKFGIFVDSNSPPNYKEELNNYQMGDRLRARYFTYLMAKRKTRKAALEKNRPDLGYAFSSDSESSRYEGTIRSKRQAIQLALAPGRSYLSRMVKRCKRYAEENDSLPYYHSEPWVDLRWPKEDRLWMINFLEEGQGTIQDLDMAIDKPTSAPDVIHELRHDFLYAWRDIRIQMRRIKRWLVEEMKMADLEEFIKDCEGNKAPPMKSTQFLQCPSPVMTSMHLSVSEPGGHKDLSREGQREGTRGLEDFPEEILFTDFPEEHQELEETKCLQAQVLTKLQAEEIEGCRDVLNFDYISNPTDSSNSSDEEDSDGSFQGFTSCEFEEEEEEFPSPSLLCENNKPSSAELEDEEDDKDSKSKV